MKIDLTIVLLFIFSFSALAQNPEKAETFVDEGIKLHDAGQYTDAITKYKQALEADSNHARALYEMCYTYYTIKKYDSAISLSNKLIALHAPDDIIKNVYVTLGNLYDDMQNSKEAEKTYKEGITKFPDFYLLYFNLGLAYYLQNPADYESAMYNFQKAVAVNPLHGGSNYWQFRLLTNQNKIPAILTACMLCIIEQKTNRSQDCASFIQTALVPNIQSDSSKKNITIYIPSSSLSKKKEDDFSSIELASSLMAASPEVLDTLQLNDRASKLLFQLQSLFNFFDQKKHKGFYWSFYTPFFKELNEKKFTNILAHLILMNSDEEAEDWININTVIVNDFYSWVKSYQWPSKE
jgi:hypothetical protein